MTENQIAELLARLHARQNGCSDAVITVQRVKHIENGEKGIKLPTKRNPIHVLHEVG